MEIPNWPELDSLRDGLHTPRLSAYHMEDDETKYVSYNFDDLSRFPEPLESVELMHITDVQFGALAFRRERFEEYQNWMLSVPNRFALFGGDMVDAATILTKANPYSNTSQPIDQVEDFCEMIKPLVQEKRILGYVGGNHERHGIPTYGDLGRVIAKKIGVPYSRGVQLIDIRYGAHQPFRVSLWHGGGGARTKGAKAQLLDRFMQKHDSQLYLIGHLHDSLLLFRWRIRRPLQEGGRLWREKTAGIMSSSFMEWWNTYAEVADLDATDTMMARVVLEPSGKWEVTLR